MTDTPDEVARRYEAMLMALSPGRRVAMALAMFDTARALAEAGLRAQGISDPLEIRRRLLVAFHGADLDKGTLRALLARGGEPRARS